MKKGLLAGVFAVSISCGGGNNTTAPSGSKPYNETIPSTSNSTLPDHTATTRFSFTVPRSGTLTLTLTWSDPNANLDLYLAPSTCADLDPKPACGILASSTATSGSTEQLKKTVVDRDLLAIFIDEPVPHGALTSTLTINIQ
jgi:hypothetical protein